MLHVCWPASARARMLTSNRYVWVNRVFRKRKGRHNVTALGQKMLRRLLFHAHCLDLFFGIALGLEGRRTNLNPGRVCRACLHDLALLRGLLLNDVVVGACRRHQKRNRGAREREFFNMTFPPLECTTMKFVWRCLVPCPGAAVQDTQQNCLKISDRRTVPPAKELSPEAMMRIQVKTESLAAAALRSFAPAFRRSGRTIVCGLPAACLTITHPKRPLIARKACVGG